ncbi:MAG TPA: phage tail protein [Thermoanaerobaculia bacterium]|nr:phage tail protein [Thermoanaerobaculia bacterium]
MARKIAVFLACLAMSTAAFSQKTAINLSEVKAASQPSGAVKVPTRLKDGTYIGEIRLFAFEQGPPKGWQECDGRSLVINNFQSLFDVIGNRFGSDEAGKFNLPDLRGTLPRGWNHAKTSGIHDPDAMARSIPPGGPNYPDGTDHVGSFQLDALQTHKHNDNGHQHTLNTAYRDDFACGNRCGAYTVPTGTLLTTLPGNANLSGPVDATGGSSVRVSSETRPSNISIMYCIRDGRETD